MIPQLKKFLPEIIHFTQALNHDYSAGSLDNWGELDRRVKLFYTQPMLNKVNAVIPCWETMANYRDGVTLTHVSAVLMGLYRDADYLAMTEQQQAILEWAVMFHDVAKVVPDGEYRHDAIHAFRSAAVAGLALPHLGFAVTDTERLQSWSDTLYNAIEPYPKVKFRQDNTKLPFIMCELDALYEPSAAMLIKAVMLHMSIKTNPEYPTLAPLTDDEIKHYISPEFYPILRVMMLVDCDGWELFREDRAYRRHVTQAFNQIAMLMPFR